ncbi:hypothetical protein VIGAN_02134800 [Vigna angularis var. angularis]|uniref:Uncharacterized protein n=1 Tax=Vigna angularis var. angularis TaxID=157739 RepID=A0A0S3RDM7_PHAAN|nr:hypothetical protein VIGAN_02134800 [Vigna angularis var. angularis]
MVVSSNVCIIVGAQSWGYPDTLMVIYSQAERVRIVTLQSIGSHSSPLSTVRLEPSPPSAVRLDSLLPSIVRLDLSRLPPFSLTSPRLPPFGALLLSYTFFFSRIPSNP